MIYFDDSNLHSLIIHEVGNKTLDEDLLLSDELVNTNGENLIHIIRKFFFSSFSNNELFQFCNDVGLNQNEIYTLASHIFATPTDLLQESKTIAQYLYSCSKHPKIKKGDLYIAFFQGIDLDNTKVDALGIFKSETKEDYLKVNWIKNTNSLYYDEGANIKKLDKGCLIFNIEKEQGYRVCIIDNSSKSNEALYWKEDFLSIKPIANEYYQTSQILNITKQFITKQLTDESLSKTEKINVLNRSVEYFKNNNFFDKEDFEGTVFPNEDVAKSFRRYNEIYSEEKKIELSDKFEISASALKKESKSIKRILKLDKNFQILINGSSDLIEKGVDEKGRKYYKIYYEEEC